MLLLALAVGACGGGGPKASTGGGGYVADTPTKVSFLEQVHKDVGKKNTDSDLLSFGQFVCVTYAAHGRVSQERDDAIYNEGQRSDIQGFGLVTGAALLVLCPEYRDYE